MAREFETPRGMAFWRRWCRSAFEFDKGALLGLQRIVAPSGPSTMRVCPTGRDVLSEITTDLVIIGAGPCGLFQVFELGLLGISAHIIDSLPIPGGQCAELYPEKPIYDIPALPVCGAQELVDRLMKQIEPFKPQFHLGEEVLEFARREDGRFKVGTTAGKVFNAGAVVIAAGVGSFQPRRIGVEGADVFEGT